MPYIANNIYDSSFNNDQIDSFSLTADKGGPDVIKLPLRVIDIRFQITGAVAKVSIQQLYEYDGDQPVDVTYQFPLPANASVYECKMKLGEKEIEAQVKPEKEANKIFTEQKNVGRRVAKMESVRENLFNLRMGNVQPGDSPIITISYIQSVECIGKQRQLRIPTCQGIRFVPGIPEGIDGATDIVPDAGKLITPRVSSDHPEAATLFCAGTYIGQNDTIDFNSPTHSMNIQNEGPECTLILGDELNIPDGDIVLQWQDDSDTKLILESDSDYGLLTVKAPDYPKAMERYVHFLLDASGSMTGKNWDSLLIGLENTIKLLPHGTKIGITLFSSDFIKITDCPFITGKDDIHVLLSKVNSHFFGGGTNFTPAFVKTVGNLIASRENPALVIITDGQFADEAKASMAAAKAGIEIHCIGIDTYVNDHALQSIARRANGTCILMQPGEKMVESMKVLANRLSRVAVKEIIIEGLNIDNLPRIYPDDTAIIPFKSSKPIENSAQISFILSDKSEIEIDLEITNCENAKLEKIYAKDRITHLNDKNENQAAIEMACANNISCQGTTWIAYDQSEKVEVSSAVLAQPSLLSNSLTSENLDVMCKRSRRVRVNYESRSIQNSKPSASFSMEDVDKYLCAAEEDKYCESVENEHTYQKKLQSDRQGSHLNKLFYILISDLKVKFKDLHFDQWSIIENKLLYLFKSSLKEHQVLDFLDRSKKLKTGDDFLLAVKDFKEHASALSSLKFQTTAKFRCYEEALFYLSELGSKAKLTKSEAGEYKYAVSSFATEETNA